MTVNFYKTSDENEVVFKHITGGSGTPCEMVNTDILNPVLKVEGDWLSYNYVGIPAFKSGDYVRYYFVSNYESLPGGHLLVYCKIDVLYTYKDAIKNLNCHVVRNEKKGIGNIRDDKLPIRQNSKVYSKTFGYDMGNFNYVLAVI